jgi:cytoskeletal protein RodZ
MKNFLYNKSDIFVALVIIAVAALIIWTRVDAIMDFPGGNAEASAQTGEVDIPDTDGAIQDATSAGAVDETTAQPAPDTDADTDTNPATSTDAAEQPAQPAEPVQFVVQVGQATSTIADNLVAAGLISSKAEFLSTVSSMGVESKLKAGTFNIQPGTSVTDIINILTK